MKIEENTRKERLKRMMEERWEMIRNISRNQERWEVEKRERDQERCRRLDERDKQERFRKIALERRWEGERIGIKKRKKRRMKLFRMDGQD